MITDKLKFDRMLWDKFGRDLSQSVIGDVTGKITVIKYSVNNKRTGLHIKENPKTILNLTGKY